MKFTFGDLREMTQAPVYRVLVDVSGSTAARSVIGGRRGCDPNCGSACTWRRCDCHSYPPQAVLQVEAKFR